MQKYLSAAPTVPYTPNLYNSSRLDIIKDYYRYLPTIYNHNRQQTSNEPDFSVIYNTIACPNKLPGSVHFLMFVKYI